MGFFSPYCGRDEHARDVQRRTLYLRAFKFWPIRIHFERGQAVIYACGACGSRPRGEVTPGREKREERNGSSGAAKRGIEREIKRRRERRRERRKRSGWKGIKNGPREKERERWWIGRVKTGQMERRKKRGRERGTGVRTKGYKAPVIYFGLPRPESISRALSIFLSLAFVPR